MSECKKTCGNCAGRIESILSKDRCDMTRNTIENYSNTCNHWEPNRETEIVMQKDELKTLRQERDELQAQVAVLRGALERARKGFVNLIDLNLLPSEEYEKDANKIAQHCFEALADTPSDAAERVQKIVELLQDAVCETENGERLSRGFCSIARGALAEWRRDKCSS